MLPINELPTYELETEEPEILVTREQDNFILRKWDQHGFWTIHMKKGGFLPKALQGKFTSLDAAERAIKQYLSTKKKD